MTTATAYTATATGATFTWPDWTRRWASFGCGYALSSTETANTTGGGSWIVRLSDGSVTVVEGGNALEARAAVESAERCRPTVGRPPREVVGVVSA